MIQHRGSSHEPALAQEYLHLPAGQEPDLHAELAPKGDLKSVVNEFKTEGMRLSRRTIKATLIQVRRSVGQYWAV